MIGLEMTLATIIAPIVCFSIINPRENYEPQFYGRYISTVNSITHY